MILIRLRRMTRLIFKSQSKLFVIGILVKYHKHAIMCQQEKL